MIVAVFGDMRVGPCVRESVTKVWSGRRESNPRHTAWEAVVLPLNYARARVLSRNADALCIREHGQSNQECAAAGRAPPPLCLGAEQLPDARFRQQRFEIIHSFP